MNIKITKNLTIFFLIAFFIFTNINFLIKYGARIFPDSIFSIAIVYSAILPIIVYLINKLKNKSLLLNLSFIILGFLFVIYIVYLNIYIDGNTIMTDRWSALNNSIHALLNGEYPYTASTHLGGRSSNLPSLLIIGMPFYFLKDVGYLQAATFLGYIFLLHKIFKKPHIKLIGLILLMLSPSYHWEIAAKSDLMSNFMIVLYFIYFWFNKYKGNLLAQPVKLGLISAFIFYTRLTTAIPLSLMILKDFVKTNIKNKALFIGSALLVIIILTTITIIHVPSLEILKNYNPLLLQNRQLPTVYSIFFIVIPLFFSFSVKNEVDLLCKTSIFLILPVLTAYIQTVILYGVSLTVFKSYFDISYLNIPIPFIIIFLLFKLHEFEIKEKTNVNFITKNTTQKNID